MNTALVRSSFGGDPYADWIAAVKLAGGVATAWPFSKGIYGGYYGRPAAKFTNATYVRAANGHMIDVSTPQQASGSGQYVYVLAPNQVAAAAPPTMNWLQKAANEAFTIGDMGAAAVGLPSLKSIQSFLLNGGLAIAGVLAVAFWLVNRRRD